MFDGDTEMGSNLSMDKFYCTNWEKSCTIEFSRDLNVYPYIKPGSEYYIFSYTELSTTSESL